MHAKHAKQDRSPQTTSEFLMPQPDAEGIAKLRDLYARRIGKDISPDNAKEVLSRVMHFQYLNILINTEGLPPRGPVPLGYRVREDGRWEEDPRDGPLVRRVFTMRAEGATIRALCAETAAAGLRSRRGKDIGPSSMLKILTNPAYRDSVLVTSEPAEPGDQSSPCK